jgi:hypothetical protein
LILFFPKKTATTAMGDHEPKYLDINAVEETLVNNIIVEKRRMITKAGNDISNGIALSLDLAFGNYQHPIRKNSYFISEDDLIYIMGKHLVSYNLIRKRQNFILKSADDEAVTCMNFYYGRKSTTARIAVGLAPGSGFVLKQAAVRIYYASSQFTWNLAHGHLSHLPKDTHIKACTFFNRGKWLAS